jgi:hypothetical protein
MCSVEAGHFAWSCADISAHLDLNSPNAFRPKMFPPENKTHTPVSLTVSGVAKGKPMNISELLRYGYTA